MSIPNEYTACERYRGYTIAVLHGRYSIFTPRSKTRVFSSSATRAEARAKIDSAIDA